MNPTWKDVMKFDLNESPIIFDVGGYKGDWTEIALNSYKNAKVFVFEPVEKFYNEIKKRYKNNPNIKVYNFGLSDKNRKETIYLDEDSSSVFLKTEKTEEINLKNIVEFLFEEKIFNVDLIKINIEGEEYRLLESLTTTPELLIFKNLLVQFHKSIDDAYERRNQIRKKISNFYNEVFNYEMVFEGWSVKANKKINCIGDSHISIFSNMDVLVDEKKILYTNDFNIYRAGPYLVYNLLDKNNIPEIIQKFGSITPLIICFGEIDCRAQIHRFVENSNYKEVIDTVIERYFNFLETIPLTPNKIILFSITPELKETPHWYYYGLYPDAFDCPKGSYDDRKKYKEYFNLKVKENAEKKGYKFISIYEHITRNDKPNKIYYLDDIHLDAKKVNYLIKYELLKNKI
jgi:FkbM family methyltransferase